MAQRAKSFNNHWFVNEFVQNVDQYEHCSKMQYNYMRNLLNRVRLTRVMLQQAIKFIDNYHFSLREKDTEKRKLLILALTFLEENAKKEFVQERRQIMELI